MLVYNCGLTVRSKRLGYVTLLNILDICNRSGVDVRQFRQGAKVSFCIYLVLVGLRFFLAFLSIRQGSQDQRKYSL